MRSTPLNRNIVLICAMVSFGLGLVVAPMTAAATGWVAALIGAALLGQWALMLRRRETPRRSS